MRGQRPRLQKGIFNPLPSRVYDCFTAEADLTCNPCACYKDPYEKFNEWPLEKQIQAASVIAIGRNQKDNGEIRCIISEILKRSPDTKLNLNLGDECKQGRYYRRNKTQDFGDGQILFFIGNPATVKCLLAYSENRIRELGEMPIDELREKIAKMEKRSNQRTHSITGSAVSK